MWQENSAVLFTELFCYWLLSFLFQLLTVMMSKKTGLNFLGSMSWRSIHQQKWKRFAMCKGILSFNQEDSLETRKNISVEIGTNTKWDLECQVNCMDKLKYGFCKKSLRKNETLTSWTLLAHFFSRSVLISADLEKKWAKSVQLVRVSFFLGNFLQNPYFSSVKTLLPS